MAELITAIGVMSGTSMDGIDASVVTTDGVDRIIAGPGRTYPYAPALRAKLITLIQNGAIAETDPLDDIEREVTHAHVDAIERFMSDTGMTRDHVGLIGIHGQTVWHNPARRFTRQLGLGNIAADRLGIDCVTRFRHADIAAGGQGAPLVPLFHKALASGLGKPLMIVNLGGVANVTYLGGDTVIAFDSGPASALIDDWMARRLGKSYDEDGRTAAAGHVDRSVLANLMGHPYFASPAPKSLDRQEFHARAKLVEGLSDADGAATLTAFTIESVAVALRHVPQAPTRWLVTGGGRLNQTVMAGLRARLGVPVDAVEAVGWNGDFLEAQCFGYLAVRSLKGLPLSLPTTTGVSTPQTGGDLSRAMLPVSPK